MTMLAGFNHHFFRTIWHLRAVYLWLLFLIMAGAVIISATEKVLCEIAWKITFKIGCCPPMPKK
jgi:hypothetical protein